MVALDDGGPEAHLCQLGVGLLEVGMGDMIWCALWADMWRHVPFATARFTALSGRRTSGAYGGGLPARSRQHLGHSQ